MARRLTGKNEVVNWAARLFPWEEKTDTRRQIDASDKQFDALIYEL